MVLENWRRHLGLWRHEGLPDRLRFHGECADGGTLCQNREDLFIDNRLYKRVASLDHLGPGKWFYRDGQAYLMDDPTGKLVELGVTPRAFEGDAEDVVIKNLVVEKYASDAQEGAIFGADGRGWHLSNVTVRWNHGAGLSFGPRTEVQGGSFSHNGQIGIVGSGEASRILDVEIAFNNYAGYDADWEAGGTKFWTTTGLLVRNSCIHHNLGPGLWTDNDNIDTVYEGNVVFGNANDGIKHEISYDATIRNNIVASNGYGHDNWLWGSQILIQNSRNVQVYNNLVEISADFGNGIGIIHQDRGEGAYGPWHAVGNAVYGNTIIHLGRQGQNGIVSDVDDTSYWQEADNEFDRNTYVVADLEAEHWTSVKRERAWRDVAELGLEADGELIVEQRAPMALSCDR